MRVFADQSRGASECPVALGSQLKASHIAAGEGSARIADKSGE